VVNSTEYEQAPRKNNYCSMEAIMWNCNMRKLLMPARCRLVHSPSAFRLLIQQQSSAAKWHNITPTLH